MKNLFLIVALFSIFFCNSQVTNTKFENPNTYYFNEAIEKPATFPGGRSEERRVRERVYVLV